MKESIKKVLRPLGVFFSVTKNRRLLYVIIISLVAFGDFYYSGLVRRTIVFYSSLEGTIIVEDRMLHRSGSREIDIKRYVEEVLLGPSFPDTALLFPRGTRLYSFLFRDDIVYADLTESALLPIDGNWDIFRSLLSLNEGIRRNFPFVEEVRLFIGGNEVFFEEFNGIFADPADNRKSSP